MLSTNKKGYAALIGLIVVILLIAVLIYGGSFFSENGSGETSVDASNKAEDMIDDINQATQDRAEQMGEEIRRSEGLGDFEIETNIEANETLKSPVLIEGTVNKGIDELLVEFKDNEKDTKIEEQVTTKSLDEERNSFSITIYFQFSGTEEGYLLITDTEDDKNFIEIPVNYKTEQ